MPQPVRGGQRYMPGLDGLRALAVLAVILYHLQFGWAQGGVLGVGVFFTLSGYLITDLLLGAWSATGRLPLADFWIRRARRLLPAVFVLLAVVTVWVVLADSSQFGQLRGALAAAALYVSNWWTIAHNQSYFARFGPPSPLGHLWSLAVEEQFYLVWPWLLWLGTRFAVRRPQRPGGFRLLAAATLVLAAASATAMALLYHPGADPTRIYEGTDTRAFGLLAGAALAMVWPSRRLAAGLGTRAGTILDCGGAAGLIVIALLVWRTSEHSGFLYRGGLVLLTAATVAVVAAVASGTSRLGRALGCTPLRWVGVRSYGIYLWHFPIIALTTPVTSGETLPRATLQVAATIVLAALSWRFVEEPIRRGGLRGTWTQVRPGPGWRDWLSPARREAFTRRWAYVGVLGLVAVALLPCPGLAGPDPATARASHHTTAPGAGTAPPHARPATGRGASGGRRPDAAAQPPALSSCRAVVHIGDSTSDGLVSPNYLPNPAQRITAQYARAGAASQHMEIAGGTSIVETISGSQNAYQVAQGLIRHGYRGCWVLALGTNDTADVSVGSSLDRAGRIEKMMSLLAGQRVMWVNVKSLVADGPYSRQAMRSWDKALLQVCTRYPDMRVYDWASQVRDSWFIGDGVHYTSAGYAARGALIANALARAFPRRGSSTGCVVRLGTLVHRLVDPAPRAPRHHVLPAWPGTRYDQRHRGLEAHGGPHEGHAAAPAGGGAAAAAGRRPAAGGRRGRAEARRAPVRRGRPARRPPGRAAGGRPRRPGRSPDVPVPHPPATRAGRYSR
jgi:peptidoglycan/LPS O-acetylase OafA/YrhL